MPTQIEIGPLCPPLQEQLSAFPALGNEVNNLERLHASLNNLYVHGILKSTDFDRCGKRLLSLIKKKVANAR